jgi:hypothetical protein
MFGVSWQGFQEAGVRESDGINVCEAGEGESAGIDRMAENGENKDIIVRAVSMTQKVRDLLDSFEALPDAEKHELAVEVLRRVGKPAHGHLSDESLTALADELFCALDAQEAKHGEP